MKLNAPIYVDYNSTTPVDNAVFEEMIPYLAEFFGNPSSAHWYGKIAAVAVDRARQQVAHSIGSSPNEIIFTSGGTESNNLAIRGIAFANSKRGNHIIASVIEHPSVLNPCRLLENQGFKVTYLPVDESGQVAVGDIENAITDETTLITVMHANNVVGTIQPIEAIGEIAKESGVYLHTDAAQSVGKLPVSVDMLGVDLLTIAGHKLYAPKGIGALYVREGTKIDPLLLGAQQEFGLRGGTEAVPAIVALGKACQIAAETLDQVSAHLFRLRQRFYELLINDIPEVRLNGHPTQSLPNTLNISFPGVPATDLLAETPEIAASTGSACHDGQCDISPVLQAMGIDEQYGIGSIRISIGKWTTEEEIDEIVDLLVSRYNRLLEGRHHKKMPA